MVAIRKTAPMITQSVLRSGTSTAPAKNSSATTNAITPAVDLVTASSVFLAGDPVTEEGDHVSLATRAFERAGAARTARPIASQRNA
jgi:hypothetical protein